jgi:hypothetical protein
LSPFLTAKTLLESPAFPTIISFGVIIAEQAVHPAPKAISSLLLPNNPAVLSLFF